MSAANRAAELRAQAAALDALAGLEADLLAAKTTYMANPTADTKAAKQEVALALREARALTRPEGHTVGGDAFVTNGSED